MTGMKERSSDGMMGNGKGKGKVDGVTIVMTRVTIVIVNSGGSDFAGQ